ncbi:fumarylacetoacetase [Cladophialophora psammophila CBS 110553]|uniref:Fumarylacetoacetase n=1 Tax=Cladophialophora psammophila CBS 110553 TaxID=1182543 RepID=W9XET8_9EURO|nr:fumarylacetoacetase [Cladophialophora psammophila CBS 110553]EXJ75461.1 fumarylacetoacetase [Cladophialophora psammophila CBS 110553]
MGSWIEVKDSSDFSLQNLPYGVFSTNGTDARIGVAIGDWVLDLKVLAEGGAFDDLEFDLETLKNTTLNAYAGLEKKVHQKVRQRLQKLLEKDTQLGHVLKENKPLHDKAFFPQSGVNMHLPMKIGNYTDFFVGLHHAKTVNTSLISASINQICPCFYNLPIAYNGRASSVVVSGTPFHRPRGQFPVDGEVISGPCRKLDIEVEFAAFIGRGNELGSPIDVNHAEDHIFGFVLLNDWSARDIQMYEATLMGPFNGKSFCTTISPWVVPLEALEPFRVAPKETPRKLPEYLTEKREKSAYDIPIRATLELNSEKYRVADCSTSNVIFSFAQMIAHHTSGGCPLRTGDLIATGTLSGPTREEAGCLLEQTRGGKEPFEMVAEDSSKGSVQRAFCEDNDTIIFAAHAKSNDGLGNVGFGTCQGKVLPAI